MDNNLPASLAGFHHPQPQSTVSEEDFLARVAAFERNEEAEARMAMEAMRRMIADQAAAGPIHENGEEGDTPRRGPRRDRSPSTGPGAVGILRDFSRNGNRTSGPRPTKRSQPPPQPPVAGFHIYGHNNTSSVYPFLDSKASIQDAYHDALVLKPSSSCSSAGGGSGLTRPARLLSDPAHFPACAARQQPFVLVPHCPHSDLKRDAHGQHDQERGRGRQSRPSYSPDRDQLSSTTLHVAGNPVSTKHCTRRANAAWPYTTITSANPHGAHMPTATIRPNSTLCLASPLAPSTSPASLAFHRRPQLSRDTTGPAARAIATESAQPKKQQRSSLHIDYNHLRTHHPAAAATTVLFSRPAYCGVVGHKERVNLRLAVSRA